MSSLKYCVRRAASAGFTRSASRLNHRHASRISIPTPPPFPIVEACPNPTCACREMPTGLDIDRERSLNGTMAAYAEQVLISTGKNDWKSKIEEEEDGVLLKQLRHFIRPGGKFSDPFHNVVITNSSFPPTLSDLNPSTQPATARRSGRTPDTVPHDAPITAPASAFLLPSFQYVPLIPTDPGSVEAFLKAFVLPSKIHASHDVLSRAQKQMLQREPEMMKQFVGARRADEIIVLICGHGGRDERCGILGPILKAEFEEKLERQNVRIAREPPAFDVDEVDSAVKGYTPTARVGLISHIGGHKFAGNVIVYIPPSFSTNALAGKGIWYGRVEPGHVEGIVAKTILDGKVIRELFRGGIAQGGEIMRL